MKNITLSIFLFVLILSCTDENTKDYNNVEIDKKTEIKKRSDSIQTDENTYDPISFIDSLQINKKTFIAFQSQSSIIVTNEIDTSFCFIQNNNGAEFKDFNRDGFLDIIVHYITNVPGIYDLALFDQKTEKFKLVQNFDAFPSPEKIKNSNYYYSYHRSGCADANWDSDLFKIENYKAIRLGNIQGLGCESEEKNGIFIHLVKKEELIQIEKYKREPNYYNDKWDFIKNYWTKNYRKFI